jgi:nicotinamidase-related amidase
MAGGTNPQPDLVLRFRRQRLEMNASGRWSWHPYEVERRLHPAETALVLCDVWDSHWCRAAHERLAALLPQMKQVVDVMRKVGLLIVHAPSDTMAFYRDTAARKRAMDALPAEIPDDLPHAQPPLPVDASRGGCDSIDNIGDSGEMVWSRQHPAIRIDHAKDVISDDGRELYCLYRQIGIKNVIIMGVHTNMCILNRGFAIKQMVKWGFDVTLVRDLTDSMYDPAQPPYVSHQEGTQLVVAYIEKFWCPTIDSGALLLAAGVGR